MKNSTSLFRFIGGILLVSGTTIGAGMLALPVVTGFVGFVPALIIFGLCWFMMLITAFFFLDVNFSIDGEINLITMAGKTLGTWAKIVAWMFYLLLLYSLIAAYIAASGPIFISAIDYWLGMKIPAWVGPFILPVLFGWFVYLGTKGVDWVNKILMTGLLISYAILVAFVPSHVDVNLLKHHDWSAGAVAISIIITSFGYHIIIPSLTTYMNHDRKHLAWTLIIGSIIPLAFYVVWEFLVLGVVPLEGKDGLIAAWEQGLSSTEPLSKVIQSKWLGMGAKFFSFFAVVTSFLGVSLSLSDFLTDGFKLKKSWEGRLIAIAMTFIPPIVFVFSSDRGFIVALEYAGICIAILLILLPALMVWRLKTPSFYKSMVAKLLIILVVAFSVGIIGLNLFVKLK